MRAALLLSVVMPASVGLYAAAQAGAKSKHAASDGFSRDIAPIVRKYCLGCHAGANPPGGINLAPFKDGAAVIKGRDVWEKVAENLSDGHMPPASAPQPSKAQRSQVVAWLESTLSKASCVIQDPGRVTMRRLNREEYNNTIRDLTGLNLRPADEFPSDDVGYGFDNIGDVLSISPLLMEKYLNAAEKVSRAAVMLPGAPPPVNRFEASKLADATGASLVNSTGRVLVKNGELSCEYDFPKAGEYSIKVRAFAGGRKNPEAPHLSVRVDGKDVQQADVRADQDSPLLVETKTKVEAGKRKVSAAFTNELFVQNDRGNRVPGRFLGIYWIEVAGPLDGEAPLSDAHKRIVFVQPTPATKDAAARQIIGAFARRAWRRPVTADEVTRLMRCMDLATKQGEPFERGIQLAVQAILVSPNFLFRVEVDPEPNNPKSRRMVTDYEMATRLSYFLWSSMPDDELYRLAAEKKLQQPAVLEAQVRRMLKDPKARALADNFAGQWLMLRNLTIVSPDTKRFPLFNDQLRAAMRAETESFFEYVVQQDRPVLDFIDAKYAFVNEPLAKLYGIEGVQGPELRKIALADDRRGGLLGQASILTVTSNPTRTSPVKRGKWVLDNLLGTPPPPAPPDVPTLADDKHEQLVGTLRQRMEQHRKNPMCAACHSRMDPLGFGLENFDAIGGWRDKDGDSPVDPSGELPGGVKFSGPAGLKQYLKTKKVQFVRCLSEKLLTYALGRGLETYDKCAVDGIIKTAQAHDYRFSSLVSSVVDSEPFRKRRGDTAARTAAKR